jgi:hypothetical protein
LLCKKIASKEASLELTEGVESIEIKTALWRRSPGRHTVVRHCWWAIRHLIRHLARHWIGHLIASLWWRIWVGELLRLLFHLLVIIVSAVTAEVTYRVTSAAHVHTELALTFAIGITILLCIVMTLAIAIPPRRKIIGTGCAAEYQTEQQQNASKQNAE